MIHPRVASRHPLKGATPEARQSRFLGIRWNGGHALRRIHRLAELRATPVMKQPPRSLRSLPPKGARQCLRAAERH